MAIVFVEALKIEAVISVTVVFVFIGNQNIINTQHNKTETTKNLVHGWPESVNFTSQTNGHEKEFLKVK